VQDPFGVLVIKCTVRIDHLWFDPYAELKGFRGIKHSEVIDLLDIWTKTIGKIPRVWCPVPKT
jgi:hypothetical protein